MTYSSININLERLINDLGLSVSSTPNNTGQYISPSIDVIANVPLVHTIPFANVTDISIYNGMEDVSDSFSVDINGFDIIINSNNTVTDLIIKVIGD